MIRHHYANKQSAKETVEIPIKLSNDIIEILKCYQLCCHTRVLWQEEVGPTRVALKIDAIIKDILKSQSSENLPKNAIS